MSVFYNEADPAKAAWLRALIAQGHLPPGTVDERDIRDIAPAELLGYAQCHFFAGIGVWAYVMRLAEWPDDRPVWTGSCPCQPFSAAGRRAGAADERHLWPAWFHLVDLCRPAVVYFEQVASPHGLAWLDLVLADLEGAGYAVGAVDLCAASFGAPHIRQRLYGVAGRVADAGGLGRGERGQAHDGRGEPSGDVDAGRGPAGRLADAEHAERRAVGLGREDGRHGQDDGRPEAHGIAGTCSEVRRLGHPERLGPGRDAGAGAEAQGGAALRPERDDAGPSGPAGRLADASGAGLPFCEREQLRGARGRGEGRAVEQLGGAPGRLADADADGAGQHARELPGHEGQHGERAADGDHAPEHHGAGGGVGHNRRPGPADGFWRDADWLFCRDGKWRPVEPGTFPLAHGAAARVVRLRGYGDGLVAPQAAAFVEESAAVLQELGVIE